MCGSDRSHLDQKLHLLMRESASIVELSTWELSGSTFDSLLCICNQPRIRPVRLLSLDNKLHRWESVVVIRYVEAPLKLSR